MSWESDTDFMAKLTRCLLYHKSPSAATMDIIYKYLLSVDTLGRSMYPCTRRFPLLGEILSSVRQHKVVRGETLQRIDTINPHDPFNFSTKSYKLIFEK